MSTKNELDKLTDILMLCNYIENKNGFERVYSMPQTPLQKAIDLSIAKKIPPDILKIILEFSETTGYYFNEVVQCTGRSKLFICDRLVMSPPQYKIPRCPSCKICKRCWRAHPYENISKDKCLYKSI